MTQYPVVRFGYRRTSVMMMLASAAILAIILVGPARAETECGTIQELVNAAAPETTINLPDGCVYRETVTVNKPLTLVGGPGVEIRGSDIWSTWSQDGGFWKAGPVPKLPKDGKCREGVVGCTWAEQVFFDGQELVQVESNPTNGQFAVDEERNVLLADDPTGHTVEVSVRPHWVLGASDNVTISDIDMRHAGSGVRSWEYAIWNGAHANWTVEKCKMYQTHGGTIAITDAAGGSLIGNLISRSGGLGVKSVNAKRLLIEQNKIGYANASDFKQQWEGAGIKLISARKPVVRNNRVHHSGGNGIWLDRGSIGGRIYNNRSYYNDRNGIHYEASNGGAGGAKIHHNVVYENGWVPREPTENLRASIRVTASRNVEVYDNVVAWNALGIQVAAADRGEYKAWFPVENVKVHDNTILQEDHGRASWALCWLAPHRTNPMFSATAKNGGSSNRYYFPTVADLDRYRWKTDLKSLRQFNKTRGEEDGRRLSDSTRKRTISTHKIPSSP